MMLLQDRRQHVTIYMDIPDIPNYLDLLSVPAAIDQDLRQD